jgi:hypothetical protein
MIHETTRPKFASVGEGHPPLSIPMERYVAPCWLSLANGDPGWTQILTLHHGARSHTVSQLVNAGTTPTWQVGKYSISTTRLGEQIA